MCALGLPPKKLALAVTHSYVLEWREDGEESLESFLLCKDSSLVSYQGTKFKGTHFVDSENIDFKLSIGIISK